MVGRELGTDGAVAVLLLDVGGAANELVAGSVVNEQGGVAADIGHRAIDDRMILEVGHAGSLGVGDRAVLQRDLGVAEGFREGQRQGTEIDLDVLLRPVAERRSQRPIGRPDHQRGIHRDQQHRANDGLGAKPERQRRQELPSRPRRHANNLQNGSNLTIFAYDRINGHNPRQLLRKLMEPMRA